MQGKLLPQKAFHQDIVQLSAAIIDGDNHYLFVANLVQNAPRFLEYLTNIGDSMPVQFGDDATALWHCRQSANSVFYSIKRLLRIDATITSNEI